MGITEEKCNGYIEKRRSVKYLYIVLEDAGVYKCTEKGREAFLRFVKTL